MASFGSKLVSSQTSATHKLLIVCCCCFIWLFLGLASASQLTSNYYSSTCPNALTTIRSEVHKAIHNETRMGASLLRLHFHDCFVDGCDASILLDDTANFTGEKTAPPNNNSIRGYDVVDTIKSRVESQCPGVVSCADILAVAARDSVVELWGHNYTVLLGRRDSTTANFSGALSDLPPPTLNLSGLMTFFSRKGLSTTDLVALSGAHTIGEAKCSSFRSRIYNDTNINSTFANSLKSNCPRTGGDDNLEPLDTTTPYKFDNAYYKNLINKKGLLHSDQALYDGGSTDSLVKDYETNHNKFLSQFGNSMVNMGNISPLTGSSGQIRTNCRKVN